MRLRVRVCEREDADMGVRAPRILCGCRRVHERCCAAPLTDARAERGPSRAGCESESPECGSSLSAGWRRGYEWWRALLA